jgi:hypothetical protein
VLSDQWTKIAKDLEEWQRAPRVNWEWMAAYARSLRRYGETYSALAEMSPPPYFWLGADAERV